MKSLASLLLVYIALTIPARLQNEAGSYREDTTAPERLGTVGFSNTCSQSTQAAMNRGMALLHDFWYEEAQRQFEQLAAADPGCAMAHWGIAMSVFHQIWNRPNDGDMTRGWSELEKAQSLRPNSDREREYISALRIFYQPGKQDFQARVNAYSAAMSNLYSHYPDDADAGAFYALSLLADKAPDDASVAHERQALAVLTPLFAKYPDHPGLAHYIIHACDNPPLASEGLAAAQRYSKIAPSAAHSAHMPAHIFARLGMWQADIESNLASVAAARKVLANHHSAIFDQLHADDFLLYAYLQSSQDANAKSIVENTAAALAKSEAASYVAGMDMSEIVLYYRSKFPVFYDLETRDWKSAAALEPPAATPPEVQTLTYWARLVAAGHLRQPEPARADLVEYEALTEQVKRGKHAYYAEATGARVEQNEGRAWAAFAQGNRDEALEKMRAAADLQDKVGQGEVDIPAREMLADMLLDLHQPEKALVEYELALEMSPNRFNGLFNAGQAAEAAGDNAKAAKYYAALLKTTGDGTQSARREFAHVKTFVSSRQVASER